jgi:hypothetical protein
VIFSPLLIQNYHFKKSFCSLAPSPLATHRSNPEPRCPVLEPSRSMLATVPMVWTALQQPLPSPLCAILVDSRSVCAITIIIQPTTLAIWSLSIYARIISVPNARRPGLVKHKPARLPGTICCGRGADPNHSGSIHSHTLPSMLALTGDSNHTMRVRPGHPRRVSCNTASE